MIKVGVIGSGLSTLSPEILRVIMETNEKYSGNLL